MRLTLRTLLAYMDDILDPADHEELGHRIEESEVATALLHRSRDVVRRLRLGAPDLVDDEGLDSNTVAEYLDNTLPSEQVVNFERVCLESDLHLAEVVSCHQILTLVLGEPAEIDEQLRTRMHQIVPSPQAAQPGLAEPAPVSVAVTASYSDAGGHKERRKPEVPEYLLAASRARKRKLAGALLGLVAAAVVVAVYFSLSPKPPEISQAGPDNEPEPVSVVAPPDPGMSDAPEPDLEGTGPAPANPDAEPPEAEPLINPASPVATDPSATPLVPAGPEPGETEPVAASAGAFPDSAPEAPEAEIPLIDFPPLDANDPGAIPGGPLADRVGNYIGSGSEALLRYNPDRLAWYRLPPGAAISPGDRLLALPTFRPPIMLLSGVAMHLAGGTLVRIVDDASQPAPTIELIHGRMILLHTGLPGSRVQLSLGGALGEVAFGDDPATVAIQLRHVLRRGDDPETAASHVVVDLYAADGALDWRMDGQTTAVQAPLHLRFPAAVADAAEPMTDIPAWVRAEQLTNIEARARGELERSLEFANDPAIARSVDLVLSELAEIRRSEIRSLVAECSVYIGDFTPFIRALSDVDQRADWSNQIETLRQALAMGPEIAAQIRQEFGRERTADGDLLYRLVWGYNPQQLQAGGMQQLIDLLDHDRLDVRVLAIENLVELTGRRLSYYPFSSPMERQTSVRTWRDRFQRGELDIPIEPAAQTPAENAPGDVAGDAAVE